jgi:hypothetical protein
MFGVLKGDISDCLHRIKDENMTNDISQFTEQNYQALML